ncbi:MAG: GtrA family protein, partial [Xanthobacteraceae bacterium]
MRASGIERDAAKAVASAPAIAADDPIRAFFEVLPQPIRFFGVGGLGLVMDLAVFTSVVAYSVNPLAARLLSLAIATLVTWRLNRALTFDLSGRRPAEEALRYAAVAAAAQFVSYALFAILI